MTEQEKRSAIKKLNERYTEMARQFGPDSAITKDFEKALTAVFGPDAMHKAQKPKVKLQTKKASKTSAKLTGRVKAKDAKDIKVPKQKKLTAADMGLSLISRSHEVLEKVNEKELDALLRKQTSGQIKRDLEREAKYESDMLGRPIDTRDVLAAMDYIYELEDDNPEYYEAIKFYWDEIAPGHKKGQKTGQSLPGYSLILELMNGKDRVHSLEAAGNQKAADAIDSELKAMVQSHRVDYNPFEVFE